MLKFVIGLMVGGTIGFMVAALCNAAKIGDEQGQVTEKDFRCGNANDQCGCQDICCSTCFVADACAKDNKCKSNPGRCGKAIKLR